MKKKTAKQNTTWIRWFWVIFTLCILTVVLVFFLISKGFIGYMPPLEELDNPINKYASQIISSDSKLLGTFSHEQENRIYISYDELSPHLVYALIATEDIRFAQHSGIDAYAIVRAIVKTGLLRQSKGGGGSTISQQLAKILYSPEAGTRMERFLQKPIEWVIAVQLEKNYTKEEIINLYLNKFDFLNNAIGIKSASYVYFGKTPKELSIEEAATMIGMCKNPSLYNPIRRNENSRNRRNVVIDQMYKNNFITKEVCDSLKTLPLVLDYHKADHKYGLAPYFREYLRLTMTAQKPIKSNYRSWQKDKYPEDSLAWETNPLYGWCNKNKKSDGSSYNVYTDGLKIYTAINSQMQQYAEDAVSQHLGSDLQEKFYKEKKGRPNAPFTNKIKKSEVDDIMKRAMKQSSRYQAAEKRGLSEKEIREEFGQPVEMTVFSWKGGTKDTTMTPMDSILYMKYILRSGMMVMDPHSGEVKAYVGGIDYQFFQYDMVNLGRRQIGSTVKPFFYSLAMEAGISPCEEVLHVEQELTTEDGQLWKPANANNKNYGEMVTVKWGLQHSDNLVTAYMMKQLSAYDFARLLRSFGFKSKIDPVLALCLGACDANIAEMVSGYSTFANKGVRVEPVYVTRIEDRNGNVIDTFSPKISEVLTENAALKMLNMLKSVIDAGTGVRMRYIYDIKAPMGGKTGTTNNHSDGWFMGFTPSLVGGVWVGGDERSIHFDRMEYGQAASMALPIFALFMKKVYADPTLGYSPSESFLESPLWQDPCNDKVSNDPYLPGINGNFEEIFE